MWAQTGAVVGAQQQQQQQQQQQRWRRRRQQQHPWRRRAAAEGQRTTFPSCTSSFIAVMDSSMECWVPAGGLLYMLRRASQHSTAQRSTAYQAARQSKARCTARHSMTQQGTARQGTAPQLAAQRGKARHAQHGGAWRSTDLAMQVVHIDVVQPQALERRLACCLAVRSGAAHAHVGRAVGAHPQHDAKLHTAHEAVAPAAARWAQRRRRRRRRRRKQQQQRAAAACSNAATQCSAREQSELPRLARILCLLNIRGGGAAHRWAAFGQHILVFPFEPVGA